MTSGSQKVKVHQAIFGYRAGHRLLASSLNLERDAERELLSMSDLAGQLPSIQYNGYLTAFPLKAAPLYALSRTWLATELERPGVVWTRVLLVAQDDLAKFTDLDALFTPLIKPTITELRTSTLTPISFERSRVVDRNREQNMMGRTKILSALFPGRGQGAPPLLIAEDDPQKLEQLFVRIWSLQWHELRLRFSFTTGGLNFRRLPGGAAFDVQLVPRSEVYRVKRQAAEPVSVVDAREERGRTSQGWLRALDLSLGGADGGQLADFLRLYGSDVPADRRSFRHLCETFAISSAASSSSIKTPRLIKQLARAFPDPSVGRRLKAATLGRHKEFDAERAIVLGVISARGNKAFDGERLSIGARVHKLLEIDKDLAPSLGRAIDAGPRASATREIALTSLASSCDVQTALQVIGQSPGLAGSLIATNPEIAAAPELWSVPRLLLDNVVHGLRDRPPSEEQFARIVEAIIASGATAPASLAFDAFGSVFLLAVLEAVDRGYQKGESLTSEPVRALLATHPKDVLDWLGMKDQLGDDTVSSLLQLLDPTDPLVTMRPAEMWLRLVPSSEVVRHVPALIFLLSVALQNPPGAAAALAAATFQPVWEAVRSGRLLDGEWRWLEHAAAKVSERTSRLQRGAEWLHLVLARTSIVNGWSPQDFVRAYKSPEALRSALETIASASDLDGFRSKLFQLAASGGRSFADPWQLETLTTPGVAGLLSRIRQATRWTRRGRIR